MKKKELGKTGIKLSELGFGCSGLWAKDIVPGKQAISDKQAFDVIAAAFDSGINFFDTGINYGFAEARLGKCLKQLINKGKKRSDFIIETKFAETITSDGKFGPSDFSPDWIKRSLEISLKNLGLEYVDMFATHGGNISDFTDEMRYCLEDLKSQGLIRAYGANTFDTDVIEWICQNKYFEYVMLDYNIMHQEREDVIKRLYMNGIGVLGGAALAQSLYSNRIYNIRNLKDLWYFIRAMHSFKGNVKKGKDFRFINKYKGATGNQIALRYVLDNKYVTSSVFNTTNPEHLKENVKATKMKLPQSIKAKIIKEGHKDTHC